MAEIKIPEGYRFVEPTGAGLILASMKNPVPKNLLGLLRPDHGGWFAIVQYADVGYIADTEPKLDAAGILKVVRENFARQTKTMPGTPAVGSVSWAFPPAYVASENRLEYAILEGTTGDGSINCCVTLLGRKGVLTVVGVLPNQQGLDLTPFRALSRGISFKEGNRYADHQPDDRMAHSTLAELIANDDGLMSFARMAMAQIESKGPWAAAALALLFAGWRLTAAAIKTRKPVRHVRSAARRPIRQPAVNGGRPPASVALPAVAKRPRNGKPLRHLGRRRHKRFSYHAFYSDMVMSLTRCNYVGGFGSFSTEHPEDINGAEYGEGTIQQDPGHTPAIRPAPSKNLVVESAQLIESQQKLIEGQRKLIEEQSKLILEKGKLIEAENRVLEKQTELFTEQQFM